MQVAGNFLLIQNPVIHSSYAVFMNALKQLDYFWLSK